MKKIFLLIMMFLAGSCLIAGPLDTRILTVKSTATNAATYVSASDLTARGYIEEIKFDVITAGTTGTLSLVAVSDISTVANVTLAAKSACDADITFRPAFSGTDTSGISITNGWRRFPLCGEHLLFSLTNASTTNILFRAIVKFLKE